jgi:hypothetical protein
MRVSFARFAAVTGLVAAFWAMPSVGTRGQGTLGDRFVHVDRALMADSPSSRDELRRADQAVARAVSSL